MASNDGLPELVPRRSHGRREAERDRAMLEWIARFRFVEAEVLAERFGVSRQQVNARIRRLEAGGLVQRRAERTSAAWTVTASPKGMQALGLPARRAARTTLQREHELALAHMVATHERSDSTSLIRTERECRRLEHLTTMRYSADIADPKQHPRARRWPDLVLEDDTRRIAIELELTAKGSTRLRRILAGYRNAPWFDEVRFLTPHPHIEALLTRVADDPARARARAIFGADTKSPAIRILASTPPGAGLLARELAPPLANTRTI